MQLKNVREWLNGKPLPLGLYSAFLALSLDVIYGAPNDWYTGCEALPDFRITDFERWRRLYWKRRRIGRTLLACQFPELSGFEYKKIVSDIFHAFNVFATTKDKTVFEQIECRDIPKEEFQAALCPYLLEKLEAFAFERVNRAQDDATTEDSLSMDLPLEMVFVFRIWLGCWLVHRESFF